MIARGSLWLPMAMLLLLAALSFWIERSVQAPANGTRANPVEPEGIMENFNALRTDPEGRPQYRLSANRLKHYTGSKRTELEGPRFVHINDEAGEVSAVAREGTVSPDGDEVDLRGDVVVERAARPGQSLMTLKTERLLLFPERDRLRAPGAVEVRDDTMEVRAGGMEYDARQRTMQFTGRVSARHISGKT